MDPDDCVSETFLGSGTACGAGGDGGYWVFLHATGLGTPTLGTVTA